MKFKKYIGIYCLLSLFLIKPIDNPHFYRATNIALEPRIEHDFLTTIDVTLASGSTHKSLNSTGSTVPLLDIYGTHLIRIENGNSIVLSIDGTFKIKESNLFYIQNFTKGFFSLFHLPIRNLQINDIIFTNLSLNNSLIPNKNISALLAPYNLSIQSSNATGAGDFTSMVGWTHNYQETATLDFVDGTVAIGMLAPTGKKRNENQIFSLPLGYNGHWGIPMSARLSLGIYGWITAGASLNTIFFIKNKQTVRLQTTTEKNDLTTTSLDSASVKKGTIWDASLFLKADHFMYGLSFTAGYSCAGEQKTRLSPTHSTLFNKNIVNADPKFKNWYMHTLHVVAEYDFAKQDSKAGPRIGFFYNYQLGGIRVFNTNMIGGSVGIDIGWDI